MSNAPSLGLSCHHHTVLNIAAAQGGGSGVNGEITNYICFEFSKFWSLTLEAVFDVFRASRGAGRYLETFLECVAPSWLNMSPWRGMAAPFMPKVMDFLYFNVRFLYFVNILTPLGIFWNQFLGVCIFQPINVSWHIFEPIFRVLHFSTYERLLAYF